jgi:hypothetical protein
LIRAVRERFNRRLSGQWKLLELQRAFFLPHRLRIGKTLIPLRASRLTAREIIGAWLIMTGASACKDTSPTQRGSAELLLSEIKLEGATNVSRRIDADESFGRSVMSGIATGDSVWLEVADKVTPASAAAAATLSIALASALPRSPERVLALLGPKYPVADVCNIPFLEPDSTLVTRYHENAVTALGQVRDTTLGKVRDECRAVLDQARQRRLERIDPSYIIKNKPVAPPTRRRR